MNTKAALIFFGCLLQLISLAAFADNWVQYQDIMSRYYTFYDQKFSQITCLLEVQPLTGITEKVRQLATLKPDNLRISDTLSNYTMTLDKVNGLTFNNPTLSIDILSEQGMADPARVKLGIREMTDGFNRQVEGVDQQLKGIFGVYQKDKPENIKITKITETAQGDVIEYKQNNMTTTSTIHGDNIHTSSFNTHMSITADSYYQKTIGHKQLLNRLMLETKGPTGTTNVNSTVTYQKLGAIIFPKTMEEHATINSQGVQITLPITVNFANCKVKP